MSNNEKTGKPKWEAPTVVALGELARGAGACVAGISDVVDCTAGGAALNNCTAGTSALVACSSGTAATSACTAGTAN
jgi:hypothetical protein